MLDLAAYLHNLCWFIIFCKICLVIDWIQLIENLMGKADIIREQLIESIIYLSVDLLNVFFQCQMSSHTNIIFLCKFQTIKHFKTIRMSNLKINNKLRGTQQKND